MFISLSMYKAIPEISSKTSLSWLYFKTGKALRLEENNEVEFLEGQFLNDMLSFVHKKETEHLFNFTFPFVSFNGVFSTLKCKTLVLKTTAW